MKVLLKQDIERLGRMGQVVEVKRGHARNYLLPQGLAVGVTRGGLKDVKEQQRLLETKAARERENCQTLADRITSGRVVIKARCSASGKLFGSITNRQVAGELSALAGEEIDRHKIVFEDRVRTVGGHRATVKLHPDVVLDIQFEVEGEGFVPEEPPEEEAEPAVEALEAGGGEVTEEAAVEETSGSDAEQESPGVEEQSIEEQE